MQINFSAGYILLAVFISSVGVLIKPCFVGRKIKNFEMTKLLPYFMVVIGVVISFALHDVNWAEALVRGVVCTALAVLGYDGVKGLLCGRKDKVV